MEFSSSQLKLVLQLHRLVLLFMCCRATASSLSSQSLPRTSDNPTMDSGALLFFKSQISMDPFNALASWNNSDLHYCRWRGVTCGGQEHPDRVVALDLTSLGLVGSLSPSLANLTFLKILRLPNNRLHGGLLPEFGSMLRLQQLNLSSNSLEGPIPPNFGSNLSSLAILDLSYNTLSESIPLSLCNISSLVFLNLQNNKLSGMLPPDMGLALPRLQHLGLSSNQIEGPIPSEFGSFSSLRHLNLLNNSLVGFIPRSLTNLSSLTELGLSMNEFSGEIPSDIGKLSSLQKLTAYENTLSGPIPPSLGNLSFLYSIDISQNNLSGSIPDSIGRLSAVIFLSMSSNKLSGTIPPSIWNISSLVDLELGFNQITGMLPPDIGNNLPNLQTLYLYKNTLHGTIPSSLSNASQLIDIELQFNQFDGKIPPSIALQGLIVLLLRNNQLEANDADGWEFFNALTNCTSLRYLQLDRNKLEGLLPSSISNLSTGLYFLTMSGNQLTGNIPSEFGLNYQNLIGLNLGQNLLSGTIPASMGMLQSLQSLALNANLLSGQIPSTLGNLTLLNGLYLADNRFNGSIPASLGKCKFLNLLDLQNNKLGGTIPREVLTITSLSRVLSLSRNSLTGPLPEEIGSLVNLNYLDISENRFSGVILSSLGECTSLVYIYMQGNDFEGTIPSSMSRLKGVQEIDFSRNNFSGGIPVFLQNFPSLYLLNISHNNFEGEVPQDGVFANVSGISLFGNKNLCGGNQTLHLPSCPSASQEKSQLRVVTFFSVCGALAGMVLLLGLSGFYYCQRVIRKKVLSPPASPREQRIRISYGELLKATDGFHGKNFIGSGSFGSVYKGFLLDDNNGDDSKIVAVKVLNLQQRGAAKSFIAECEALRNIRHRNLVKILTSCSSTDFRGNDFKALVYEFMPNGSLDKWLHEKIESTNLKLIQRLNIAIDVASALHYLHRHGETPMVHCDLKPSNVLLDDNMTAHVSDFGLASFLNDFVANSSDKSTSTNVLKGSVGYVAPEYGVANRISTQGDVYSYGIFLLEILTAKRPVDVAFKQGQGLMSLHKYVEMALPDRVTEIMDARMLAEVDASADPDHARRKSEDCIASVLKIGLLCSKEVPAERMEMEDVVSRLQGIRDVFLRAPIQSEKEEEDQGGKLFN